MDIEPRGPLAEARKKAQIFIGENVRIFFEDFEGGEDALGAFVMSIEDFDMEQLQACHQALALSLETFSGEQIEQNPLLGFYKKCKKETAKKIDKIRK
ncbi:hypothetical protein C0581_02380 [Candidatus Parcubacteria bacterium]|nr:MAG: hypothetical protein C0581_02380 [Candidatus Parcubacteria bacterium]